MGEAIRLAAQHAYDVKVVPLASPWMSELPTAGPSLLIYDADETWLDADAIEERVQPYVPVVILTSSRPKGVCIPLSCPVLRKPFGADVLMDVMRKMISGRSPP
jgi:hypothetical protein